MFKQNYHKDLGLAYYETNQHFLAIPHLKKAIRKDPANSQLIKKLTLSYYKTNRNDAALKAFLYLDQHNLLNDTLSWYYIKTLKKCDKKNILNQLKAKLKVKNELIAGFIKTELEFYDSTLTWIGKKHNYFFIKSNNLNTPFSELNPSYRHKDQLVFLSNRESVIIKKKSGDTGMPAYNIFVTRIDSIKLVNSKKVYFGVNTPFSSLINSPNHEGAASFSSDGKYVFYSRLSKDEDNQYRFKLYQATKGNVGWENELTFSFNKKRCSFIQPFIDSTGLLFFFTSDMEGGYGGTDIYVCIKKNELWSNPINLGPSINTVHNEINPYFSADSTLYFASNRPNSMGGYDLFSSKIKDDEWGTAQNLKHPLNSIQDDLSFLKIYNNILAIVSNRTESKGETDILFFRNK